MFKSVGFTLAIVTLATGLASDAASAATRRPTRRPAKLTAATAEQLKHRERFKRFNHLSPATKGLVKEGRHDQPSRLRSFATFTDSFTTDGVTFPYTMVGRAPRRGGETRIDTSLIMLSFKFDEFADAQGNSLVINSNDIVGDVIGSPNFVKADYTVGRGQFGDAVQRASFFQVAERDWHTTIERPRLLTPVTIEVPVGLGQVFDVGNGKLVADVDFDFLFSQIQTILQLEDIRTDELPILISHNVFAGALGFHDAFEVTSRGKTGIQTYTWSSWLDEEAFGPIFADATTLTHEISEWISDPFINNAAPAWILPGSGGACLDFLEVGDPIEFLDTQMFPITINGHLYHTQNEATLSWFARDVPSKSFGGGYSYPDTTVLTAPSESCTVTP